MLPCILTLLKDGIITDDDLEGFSQDFIEQITYIRRYW